MITIALIFPHQLFYRPFSRIRFEGCYDGVLKIFKDFKILHVISKLQLGWESTLYWLLGSVDVLYKKLIYTFQLDNLKCDFFNRNSGMEYRHLQAMTGISSSESHHLGNSQ
jgi:hypothetical protein